MLPKLVRWTLLAALGLGGCTPIGASKPVAAAVFAGSAVAATAAKRKVAGGCWANCSKGWHCDEERGLCVEDAEQRPSAVEFERPAPAQAPCQPPLRCDAGPLQ